MVFMDQSLKRRIPNAITMLRILIAGAFFAVLGGYRYPDQGILWGNVAIALFVIAAITDFLDGYLARKWDVVSMFGRLMDPFCDKVLVLGAFVYLAGTRFSVESWVESDKLFTMASGVYPWMVVAIIARELLVTSIRDVLESMGHSGGAKWAGKAKMILQSVAVPIVLLLVVNFSPDKNSGVMLTINILVWLMLIVTLWSGLPYVTGLMALMRKQS
jgi:CDP-diacylglycerol--glycerol-3-phosphate 3-phosphatidyltransferase